MVVGTYILAGGESRRFGSDKGLFELNGEPLIQSVARIIAPLGQHEPVIVGASQDYSALSMPLVPDILPGLGPVGGLLSALAHLRQRSGHGCAVIVACDMPWLDRELLQLQLDLLSDSADALACVPWVNDRWTATHGVYRLRAQPRTHSYIESGGRKLQHLMQKLDPLDPVPTAAFPRARWQTSTRSANKPADLASLVST